MEEVFVIGGDHHNTLGVIRALGYRDIKSNVILVTSNKYPYVGYSKYIKNKYIVSNDDRAIDLLKKLVTECHHPIVIACSDSSSSAIDQNRDELIQYYSLPGSSIQGRITENMNKERMREIASRVGLLTPLSWVVQKGESLDHILFPCITKPLLSKEGNKTDICICSNRGELENAISRGSCEKYQIQFFIEKEYEYQLIGLSIKEGHDVVIPGLSRCIRPCPGTNTGFLHYESLEGKNIPIQNCKEYIREIGYSGLFSMEFIRGTDGNDYFLEINFRNDGNAICVTKSGINLPYMWCLANEGLNYKEELNICKLKPTYVMPEFDDFRCFVLTRKITIKQWLADIKRTDAFMEYDNLDLLPFWCGVFNLLLAKIQRGISNRTR